MVAAGFDVVPEKVYPVFNMEDVQIFVAYARQNELPGLVIYTPDWEDEPIKFQPF